MYLDYIKKKTLYLYLQFKFAKLTYIFIQNIFHMKIYQDQ